MPSRIVIHAIRAFFLLCCVLLGVSLGLSGAAGFGAVTGGILGAVFGLAMIMADLLLRDLTIRSFASGTFGLMTGIFCAWLLTRIPLVQSFLPPHWAVDDVERIFNLAIYLALGYIGTVLALRSNQQEFSLIIPYVRFRNEGVMQQPLLIDTNIIIDGRLPGICAAGFIGGPLIVPNFVLEELHALADSSDLVRRERGRRGLESLETLRRTPALEVTIHDSPASGEMRTDTRLVHLAKSLDARILTNDANLGRVAQLQGVTVLNLNHLAAAMRPQLNIGDEVGIVLVREGKDPHQAVGYLPDGTMIVVNHAREWIGSPVTATVSSALQTSAGTLLFAELKSGGDPAPSRQPGVHAGAGGRTRRA